MTMYDPSAVGPSPLAPRGERPLSAHEQRPFGVAHGEQRHALTTHEERPLGVVVSELWENTEKLVRAEMQLGLAEIDQRVSHLKKDVTLATMGGAVMYAGVLALVAAVVLLLAKVVAPWLSALIVGVVVAGAGFAMLQRGKNDLLKPKEANESSHTFKSTHSLHGGRT